MYELMLPLSCPSRNSVLLNSNETSINYRMLWVSVWITDWKINSARRRSNEPIYLVCYHQHILEKGKDCQEIFMPEALTYNLILSTHTHTSHTLLLGSANFAIWLDHLWRGWMVQVVLEIYSGPGEYKSSSDIVLMSSTHIQTCVEFFTLHRTPNMTWQTG